MQPKLNFDRANLHDFPMQVNTLGLALLRWSDQEHVVPIRMQFFNNLPTVDIMCMKIRTVIFSVKRGLKHEA